MQKPITARIGKQKYKTDLAFENHLLLADEPESIGGEDLGPTSGTLLKMSLAACTAITLRMYADRKGWDLEEAIVEVDYEKNGTGTLFQRHIRLVGNLDQEQRTRLMQIANACPVHKTLTHPIEIQTLVREGGEI
jgi:putative redox protein